MTGYYHLCFAVPSLAGATADLTRLVGVGWQEPREGRLGDWDYRIVFSAGGPPFFEVIEGSPGSPWDATAGARFDHLGYWSADLAADSARLVAAGAPVDFDACPYGRAYVYHRVDSIGARVELVDLALRPGFLETWGGG